VWGVLLLVGIGAWLWLPSLPTRDAIAGTALVAVAGLLALPIAGAIDSEEPWIDFREWEFGRSKPSTFDWNHSYDPLDWPRDGTVLAAMESDRPQYWRTAVLDEFDGVRWQRPEQSFGERLELPNAVEGDATEGSLAGLNRKWLEEVDVTVGPMESEFVLGAGAVVSADGLDSVLNLPNGTAVTGDEPLEEGDSYSVLSYAPDPSVRQLRAAPTDYSPSLARYTELTVPGRPIAEGNQFVDPAAQTSVEVPLRGTSGGSRAASRELADSPYAGAYRLAQRLTADEPTAFDATKAIERHFQTGFTYTENPPEHRVPLAGFLSTSRSGYCQQFSGAMALMLRMLGIPSRVVSGFSPGTADPDDEDRYLVEDLDAHSWVEAYFPKIGWVTFDPTPSGGAPATGRLDDSEIDSVGATTPSGNDPDNLRRKGFTPGEGTTVAPVAESSTFPLWIPAAIGIAGLLALAALAAITAVRRFRYSRLSPVAAAEAHLRELPLALTRLGWPYSPSDTLLDLEDVLLRHGKRTAPRYIAKLRTGRFAATHDGTPTLAERRALRDDLTASDGVRSRLRGLLALPPGGPG
jgi:transglutaminase-like putative cysteine protease